MTLTSEESDRRAVEAVRAEWVRSIAARDANALRDLLTEDYEVWANGAPPISGAGAAVAAMSAALTRNNVVQSFDPIETIICGDWAFERGVEHVTVTPIDGGPARSGSQRAILILKRGADGRWRYARGMTNGLPSSA